MKERLRITADDRERASGIPDLLREFDEVDLIISRLRTGDYCINDSVLIERKTVADFAVSIIDARLFKQAQSLNRSPYRPAFLLEGAASQFSSTGMTREALQGALISLTLIFNIPVFRSLSKEESARILVYTANQLKRVGKGIYPNAKWKPKSRKGRQLRILQNLPGIGRERAQLLLEGFGSVENCITADLKALMRVDGIGPKTAEGIRSLVSESKALYGCQDSEWDI